MKKLKTIILGSQEEEILAVLSSNESILNLQQKFDGLGLATESTREAIIQMTNSIRKEIQLSHDTKMKLSIRGAVITRCLLRLRIKKLKKRLKKSKNFYESCSIRHKIKEAQRQMDIVWNKPHKWEKYCPVQ